MLRDNSQNQDALLQRSWLQKRNQTDKTFEDFEDYTKTQAV